MTAPAPSPSLRRRGRRLRFALIERIALPAGVPPLRAVMRTWRLDEHEATPMRLAALADQPRAVVGICHGMLLHVLALYRLPVLQRRRIVVLLSPSLDGRLLAAFLARFGIGHAVGTSGARGVGGAQAFARRVAAGDLGIVAVDGPRGPCARVTPGFLRLAAAGGATPHLIATAAAPGHTFASWDRAHLPAPFARVRSWCSALPCDASAAVAQARLRVGLDAVDSPLLRYAVEAEDAEDAEEEKAKLKRQKSKVKSVEPDPF